jgi:hypothetical protein
MLKKTTDALSTKHNEIKRLLNYIFSLYLTHLMIINLINAGSTYGSLHFFFHHNDVNSFLCLQSWKQKQSHTSGGTEGWDM